jgi:3-carboxy-cis,cis-muconate cycloisomerase
VQALAASHLAIGVVPVVLGAMAQAHERAAGGWQVEWQAIPEIFRQVARAVHHVRLALAGLEVHEDRMRDNLALAGGTLMAESLEYALVPHFGRQEAQRLAAELSQRARSDGRSLAAVAGADSRVTAVLGVAALATALDPAQYLGSSDAMIDAALRSWREYRKGAAA